MTRFVQWFVFFAVLAVGPVCFAQIDGVGPAEREALVKLQSSKPSVRRDGIGKLAELKNPATSGELARVATVDPDASVRRAAVVALGKVRDRARIPDMLSVLKDPDAKVRGGAIEGLVNLYLNRDEGFFTRVRSGFIRVVPFWDERQSETVEPYDTVDPTIPPALADIVRTDASSGNRVAAVRALGALKASSEIDTLADAMAANEKLRPEILDAFVLIDDTEAARYAIPFFESPDASIAKQAMLTAGLLRSAQAVTPLLTVYGSDKPDKGIIGSVKGVFSPDRKKAAIQALALIGDPSAEDVFTSNVQENDIDIRRACYEGIARIGDARFLPLVQRNSQIEKSEHVRLAQTFALYKMKQPGMFQLIANSLRDGSRREQAAAYVFEADSQDNLLPFIRMPDRKAQAIIIDALGRIGDQKAIDELRPIVRGSSPEIALVADRTIRRIEWRLGQASQTTP